MAVAVVVDDLVRGAADLNPGASRSGGSASKGVRRNTQRRPSGRIPLARLFGREGPVEHTLRCLSVSLRWWPLGLRSVCLEPGRYCLPCASCRLLRMRLCSFCSRPCPPPSGGPPASRWVNSTPSRLATFRTPSPSRLHPLAVRTSGCPASLEPVGLLTNLRLQVRSTRLLIRGLGPQEQGEEDVRAAGHGGDGAGVAPGFEASMQSPRHRGLSAVLVLHVPTESASLRKLAPFGMQCCREGFRISR